MRVERLIYSFLTVIAVTFAALNWRKAALFQAENDSLRARFEEFERETTEASKLTDSAKIAADKIKSQSTELMQLRNEVTQLRGTSKTAETLTTENQRLQSELQRLRTAPAVATAPANPQGATGRDQFPRESWNFAGYASPEAALVSAIWAMKQGDPKTYLDSLSPSEQQRMAQTWQNKNEGEIAEKHKSDVASISNLRVLDRQNISPNEVVMNVFLEGTGRLEKIRMNQVGQDWKFGGFIREAGPAPAGTPVQARPN